MSSSEARDVIILTHMLGRFLDDFGNVVRYLHQDGARVVIYASRPVETSTITIDSRTMFDDYRKRLPAGVDLRPLPYVRGLRMKPWDIVRMFALGFRLARRYPDAMFVMWSVYLIIALGVPLRLFNRRSLYLVTGLGPVLGSRGQRFLLFRAVIIAAYRFLMAGRNSRCLNHNEEDRLWLARTLHAGTDKFFVTPGCGVDPELFPFHEERPANDPPVVLVPARLIADKGIPEAIEASNLLRSWGVDHQMWFTGAVEPYPWIRVTENDIDLAQRANPCIRFIGFQRSMPELYAKVDVVCYPTRYPEGTPTVLIEAAASGRPAVTCDTVGAREIVIDGETGFVVPQRDAAAVARGVQRLLTEPDLYERFRRRAYEHFRQGYTKDLALDRTLAAFESVGFRFTAPRTAPDFRREVSAV